MTRPSHDGGVAPRFASSEMTPRSPQYPRGSKNGKCVCRKCRQELPETDFAADASKPTGRATICRPCDRTRSQNYYRRLVGDRPIRPWNRRPAKQSGPKMCAHCKTELTPSRRHKYCATCGPAIARARSGGGFRRRPRGKTSERGYGIGHQRLRASIDRDVQLGGVVCVRCGELIEPGEAWDLGHDDHDRSRHSGPEHARCNRATAGRPRVGATSREW
jgi:hypothetical protein